MRLNMRWFGRTVAYRFPKMFRFMIERAEKSSRNADAPFWDGELTGSKTFYLSNMLHIRCRTAVLAQLICRDEVGLIRVLDVGCAAGQLRSALSGNVVRTYVGVDISRVAVECAKKRFSGDDDKIQSSFVQADLCSFRPAQAMQFDVIVFSEVLYYLPIEEVVRQVNRFAEWLAPEGRICLCMKRDPKSKLIYKLILKEYRVANSVLLQMNQEPGGKYRVRRSHRYSAVISVLTKKRRLPRCDPGNA